MKPPFIPNVISEMKEYLDEIALFNHINQDKSEENNQEMDEVTDQKFLDYDFCLLYTSPSPRDQRGSRMPSSA